MSEEETSALYHAALYALVMVLLVFATVTLWDHISVYLLLGLPMVYYLFQDEWEEYKKQKRIRKEKNEVR